MRKLSLFKLSALSLAAFLACGTSHADRAAQTQEVDQFIEFMVEKHDFDKGKLVELFKQVKFRDQIIKAISRPAESKPWYEYRPIFVTEIRIREGVEFLRTHFDTLSRAEADYGVPPEIITAIIGVETRYGRHKGGYRVMDALSTLAFSYPPRSKFFISELEHFLLLARDENIEPLSIKGSYAGAMGQPQFISSSYRSYAIDFDGDGQRNLWSNTADSIGSVANYLHRHGWQRGAAITSQAAVNSDNAHVVVAKGIKPHSSLSSLAQSGIQAERQLDGEQDAALIELENKSGREYWLGLNNFYVITRYNHSALYAMAVYQLSQEILSRSREKVADAL